MRTLACIFLLAFLAVAATACGGSSEPRNPYAVTCGELKADPDLAASVTEQIAEDVHDRRTNFPLQLIEASLELVEVHCADGSDSTKPGRLAYEGEVEFLKTSPESLGGLAG